MFTEFKDVDLSDEEHRAHPALGSTALKSYLTDAAPSPTAAALGNAVHILAFQPHLADQIAEKPAFRGDVEEWLREHAGQPVERAVNILALEPHTLHGQIVIQPKFTGQGARTTQPAEFAKEHAGKVILTQAEHEKVLDIVEALRLHQRGASIYLAPSELDKARAMARALCRCEGLQKLLERPDAERETTVLAKHGGTGLWVKSRPDMRGGGHLPHRGGAYTYRDGATYVSGRHPGRLPCRITVDAKTTAAEDDDAFARDVARNGYDMQQSLYGDVEQDRHGMPCVRYIYAVQKVPGRDGEHKVLELRLTDEWVEVGRKKYEAALIKAAIERKTQARPELHWEGPHMLPEPPPWVVRSAERIERHARRLAIEHDIDYPED